MALRTTALAALLGILIAAPLRAQDLQVPDFVRLPGVYTTKEEPRVRQISIKQVSACVADDPGLHARATELVALEEYIVRESDEIDSLGEALSSSDATLRIERSAFDELVARLENMDQALKEMSSSINRLGEDKSSRESVERYNAAVDAYNAEVRKRNAQLAEVKRAQAEFRTRLDAHNDKVREQHRRIDEYNVRRATLLTNGDAFLADVRNFDSDCLRPGED